jgi:hypothetical protein
MISTALVVTSAFSLATAALAQAPKAGDAASRATFVTDPKSPEFGLSDEGLTPPGNWQFGTSTTTPLTLFYTVDDLGGGIYNYEFRLKLTNLDGSWQPGQGWRWFIWGDCRGPCTSPLTSFIGDPSDLPVGPWTGYSSSGGGHNGPTFSEVLLYWIPLKDGETLAWSGTSTANLTKPGELLFSTIAGTLGGAVPSDYQPACLRGGGGGFDPCDTNCDGTIDAFDIEPFIDLLVNPTPSPCSAVAGDANGDGVIDAFDIEPFIACLVGP